jgi:hypothetical protein
VHQSSGEKSPPRKTPLCVPFDWLEGFFLPDIRPSDHDSRTHLSGGDETIGIEQGDIRLEGNGEHGFIIASWASDMG